MSSESSEESLHLFLSDDDPHNLHHDQDVEDLEEVQEDVEDRAAASHAHTLTSGFGSDLLADESLSRNSPELWPDTLPGVGEFVLSLYSPICPSTPPSHPPTALVDTRFFPWHDLELLTELSQLGLDRLLREVRTLHDIAFDLGLQEAKEMTRGRFLNILKRRSNSD